MERFKVLEKEMKIKAYSKEGLSQAAKLDPRELEKAKIAQWINAAVDKLGTQTDALEAELEALQLLARKTKRLDGDKQERLDILPETIERHKTHVRKLEQLLRLVENDRYGPDEVNAIKDDVEYYVEANQEPDFVPDDDLYEQFDLVEDAEETSDNESDSSYAEESEEATSSSGTIASPGLVATKKTAAAPELQQHQQTSPPAAVSLSPGSLGRKKAALPIATDQKGGSSSVGGGTVSSAVKKASSPPTVISSVPLPINLPSSMPNPATPFLSPTLPPPPPTAIPKVSGPSFASAIAAGAAAPTSPNLAAGNLPTAALPNVTSGGVPIKPAASSVVLNRPSVAAALATGLPTAASVVAGTKPATASAPSQPMARLGKKPPSFIPLPGPYEEFYAVMQRRQEAAAKTKPSPKDLMAILESSYVYCPDGYEMERSRTFTPKQPFSVPPHYPSHPPPILENPAIFERFELDTLFFIFYYQQKTYAQYLAARELKRQSWRFHKKYLTWFQRHEEPKTLTDEYEQGTYIYFDYEGNWCQRKKSEFTFEYRYLEDEETV